VGRVTGLGGVFVKSADPDALKDWYASRLGVDVKDFGANFEWRELEQPEVVGYSVWGVFGESTAYFEPSRRPFMVNLRVQDLDGLLEALRKAGEAVDERVEACEYGRFGWVMDPDGTRIELWEPPPSVAGRPVAGVEQIIHRFLAAVDTGDAETLASCFEPDASMYFPFENTSALVEGREAIMERFLQLFDAWRRRDVKMPYVGFKPEHVVVRSAGPGHALATFTVGIEGAPGRRTVLARDTLDGWRVLHLHASNLSPRATGS
jgi:predicted enzyme related to lactoylglutathione lyase/ketosteroid isomerase-like protein